LVLDVSRGPEHCGWESTVFIMMAWPVGSRVGPPIPFGGDRVRQFVRDPDGAVASELEERFDLAATLPPDATTTGFHHGEWELFTSASAGDKFVYLVTRDTVERWPSSVFARSIRDEQTLIGCA
ncbi:MAG: hypothetical protein ACRD1T_16530, partial [Acidimicrobiia bacterium]